MVESLNFQIGDLRVMPPNGMRGNHGENQNLMSCCLCPFFFQKLYSIFEILQFSDCTMVSNGEKLFLFPCLCSCVFN
uniref:Uncharacterized protein n=1 Tax=Rhizophora mucronata TaxID=61149 RepID=A0A2P2N0I2_RHIMU